MLSETVFQGSIYGKFVRLLFKTIHWIGRVLAMYGPTLLLQPLARGLGENFANRDCCVSLVPGYLLLLLLLSYRTCIY